MSDYLEQLERLTNLFERGALSREEFEAEKLRLKRNDEQQSRESLPSPHMEVPVSALPRQKLLLSGVAVLAIAGVVGAVLAAGRADVLPDQANTIERTSIQEESRLQDAVSFADLANCAPGADMAALLDDMASAAQTDGGADAVVHVAGLPDPLPVRTASQEEKGVEVRLAAVDVDTRWRGLRLREIRTVRWGDGLANGFRLQFAEPVQRVSAVLDQGGLEAPQPGSLRQVGDRLIGIERQGSGTALLCVDSKKSDAEGDA